MTVGEAGEQPGKLNRVEREVDRGEEAAEIEFVIQDGIIQADLRIGADVASVVPMEANQELSNRGYCLFGQGFVVDRQRAEFLRKAGCSDVIHPYLNGRDVNQNSRDVFVIDVCEYEADYVRQNFPSVHQHLLDFVKPERDQNNRESRRKNWWIYGEPNPKLRRQLQGLSRYIATVETSKHRFFVLLDQSIHPDNMLVNIASDRGEILGVLSSKIHVCWALATGGRLGVGNDPRYNRTRCFETFPFPDPDDATKQRIGDLAEQLDAHRKRQQEKHPTLTMTGMYNVLEKLRAGETLTAKDQTIHEQGLVSVLKQIHDDLDAVVFDAYGWPRDLDDEAILQRLVDLNHERAKEESRGIVRWLRPEFQNPNHGKQAGAKQTAFAGDDDDKPVKKSAATKPKKQPWPKTLPDRMVAIQSALQRHAAPADAKEVAAYYTRANKAQVTELLETLVAVGNVRQLDDGRFASFN